jgi:hypothetical protein
MNLTQDIPIGATCHSCRWYQDNTCRRHSPDSTGWPFTSEDQYCGDWSLRYIRADDNRWQPFRG